MTERQFFGTPGFESPDALLRAPDAWPLYPIMPLHRDEAETGVLIASPGFPRCALVLVNMADPILRRMLAWEDVGQSCPEVIAFETLEAVMEDGWSLGERPGWGLEHMRDWDRRTKPCPECDGRGYKGLSSLPVPCRQCEATGTQVTR